MIHANAEGARKESPFGGPMAHGYCALSLAPYLLGIVTEVKEKNMGVNYGLNRLRFTSSMPIASRVRLRAGLVEIEEIKGGGGPLSTCNLSWRERKNWPAWRKRGTVTVPGAKGKGKKEKMR